MTRDFTWRDGERIVRFGRGAVAEAPDLLGDDYVLLTTPRAAASAPAVVDRAAAVHHVPAGPVDEVAGDLNDAVAGDLLVALGGGRVVDVAKALAAAHGAGAAAIPTTLSAAEMTRGHRHARGVDPATPRVRPRVVLNDPALSASQPAGDLAASAANALGHAIEGTLTPLASPVPVLAARKAARLLAHEDDRDALALGALLAGYVIDSTGYGLHHVLAQTLARFAGVWHGSANAAMLPHTAVALRERAPAALAALDAAAGVEIEALARRLAHHAGAQQLHDLGVDEAALETCVREVLKRSGDLAGTPPAAGEAEIRALYEAAY
ncbi:MAG TPA: iron-containing alcohol dehydrogenase [Solirubrobacteraceae bacterium]|nr:iron-containing alcohol dehydrogenase [Solirubrobacteraceae bacterium]